MTHSLTHSPPHARTTAALVEDEPIPPDPRFGALLGPALWARLPAAVRRRFGKRLAPGASVTYAGVIVESRHTRLGTVLAQACRLIGAPLPLSDDIGAAAVVTLTEDGATGGQFWTRIYARTRGFPQVIHSSKRFSGPTGLEEYLGRGFGLALTVSGDETGLRFHGDHYFLALGGLRWRLPRWLEPGALTVGHIDRGDGWFAFVLSLRHPLLGELVHQTGLFRERLAPGAEENLPDGRAADDPCAGCRASHRTRGL